VHSAGGVMNECVGGWLRVRSAGLGDVGEDIMIASVSGWRVSSVQRWWRDE